MTFEGPFRPKAFCDSVILWSNMTFDSIYITLWICKTLVTRQIQPQLQLQIKHLGSYQASGCSQSIISCAEHPAFVPLQHPLQNQNLQQPSPTREHRRKAQISSCPGFSFSSFILPTPKRKKIKNRGFATSEKALSLTGRRRNRYRWPAEHKLHEETEVASKSTFLGGKKIPNTLLMRSKLKTVFPGLSPHC